MTDGGAATAGAVTKGSMARVGVATAITAVCGYAVLYLAARTLDPAGFSLFGVFWGAFGLVTGAANGLLQEATREVRQSQHTPVGPGAAHTHPMRVATAVGVAAAAVIAATAPWWAERIFVASTQLSVALLAAGLAGFCLHATLLGMLAGVGRWTAYGSLMVTDAVIRVLLAIAAFLLGWGLVGFLWATVAGAIAWALVLTVSATARSAARVRTVGSVGTFLRGTAHSVAAAGASAVLVMGFPVLLQATSGELGAAGGVVILAVTLTRAPLLVPLTAMQGNLIAHFVDHGAGSRHGGRRGRLRALLAPVAVVCALGAVGVVAAGTVGPWLLRTAFGPGYQTGGALLAWLTAGSVTVALLTLTGAATVAAALHRAYALGWVSATVAAAALLTLPLDTPQRAVVALLCGPLVGIAVHLSALTRA